MAELPALEKNPAAESAFRRPVRSFVLRGGRLTDGQKKALDQLLPRYGLADAPRLVDFGTVFGNAHPLILEIGFGDGDATWQMAREHPEENYLGVEVHLPGVGRLLMQLENKGIENVRVVAEDAVIFLGERVADASLDGVRIYFPDPWPKKRHHKRRIVQRPFIALLARKMKAGGILHLATDWAPYAEHMLEVMNESPEFMNQSPTGGTCSRPDWRPRTKYERRGERLGHEVADLVFCRVENRADS